MVSEVKQIVIMRCQCIAIFKILTSAFLRNELLIDRPHLALIVRESGPDRMDRPGLFNRLLNRLLYTVGNSAPCDRLSRIFDR